MQAAFKLVPAYVPDEFAELARPCLRHVELEVDYELVDEDFARLGQDTTRIIALEVELDHDDPDLDDRWFGGDLHEAGRAVSTVTLLGLGAIEDDDGYLPEPRSYRVPIAVGVGIAMAAAAVLVAAL